MKENEEMGDFCAIAFQLKCIDDIADRISDPHQILRKFIHIQVKPMQSLNRFLYRTNSIHGGIMPRNVRFNSETKGLNSPFRMSLHRTGKKSKKYD